MPTRIAVRLGSACSIRVLVALSPCFWAGHDGNGDGDLGDEDVSRHDVSVDIEFSRHRSTPGAEGLVWAAFRPGRHIDRGLRPAPRRGPESRATQEVIGGGAADGRGEAAVGTGVVVPEARRTRILGAA